jgi:hypothetical protein
MRRSFFQMVDDLGHRAEDWMNRHPEVPRTVVVVGLAVMALMLFVAALPLFLAVAAVFAVVLFARAWLREFSFLMGVDDSAFPGHHDKLIWALLLIVLPPVGVYLFRAHRRAYWPESETKSAAVADELS